MADKGSTTIPPLLQSVLEKAAWLGSAEDDQKPCFKDKTFVSANGWKDAWKRYWYEENGVDGANQTKAICNELISSLETYKRNSKLREIVINAIIKLYYGLCKIHQTYATRKKSVVASGIDTSILLLETALPDDVKARNGIISRLNRPEVHDDPETSSENGVDADTNTVDGKATSTKVLKHTSPHIASINGKNKKSPTTPTMLGISKGEGVIPSPLRLPPAPTPQPVVPEKKVEVATTTPVETSSVATTATSSSVTVIAGTPAVTSPTHSQNGSQPPTPSSGRAPLRKLSMHSSETEQIEEEQE